LSRHAFAPALVRRPAGKEAVRARVEQLTTIATLPNSVSRITLLMNSSTAAAALIADEISNDQVLAGKVLKLVNSGFCGFRKPIATITHAMVLLGVDVVRSLVISATVIDMLDMMTATLEGLWEHSVGTARAAKAIAERVDLADPEELAVAGLMHDLGKVVIAQAFPEEHARIREVVAETQGLQIDAERDVLGVTHLEVGMWLLKKWALPSKLVYPIAYHNNFHPNREFADRTAVVHLADIVCRAMAIGYPGDDRVPPMDRRAWELLRLTPADLEDVCLRLEEDQTYTP